MVTDLVDYLFERAQRQASEHFFEESIDTCKEILRRASGDSEAEARAHGFLGDIYLLVRDLPAAERHLRRAVKCEPGNGEYHYLMGCALTVASRFPEAINSFRSAEQLLPDNAEVLRGLGWAIHCTGGIDEAEGLLRRSVGIDPGNVSALNDLAVCLMTQHRYDDAIGIVQYALDLSPEDHLLTETHEAALSLRQEYNRLLVEAERSRRSLGSRGYARPVYARVEELFDRSMRRGDYTSQQRENACKLWQDFLRKSSPQIRKAEIWAAAVEYAVAELDSVDKVTCRSISKNHQVAPASVVQAYRRIVDTLELNTTRSAYSARERSKSNHPSAQ